jgi:hypothetical protein
MLSVWPRRSTLANQPENQSWQNEVSELLARAAQLCVEHDVEIDPFMRGAASAYFEARPGMREYIEELELKQALQSMRENGRIASA